MKTKNVIKITEDQRYMSTLEVPGIFRQTEKGFVAHIFVNNKAFIVREVRN